MENTHAEEELLDQIRSIILREDRSELQRIRNTIEVKEELSQKVNPIIEERLEFFKSEFPREFKGIIDTIIDERIQQSQAEILNIIYPLLGKMVKKYVAQEIKVLSEKIDNQLSFISAWKRKLRSFFGGSKEKELLLDDIGGEKIEQVMLIERGSGLLKASFSKTETIDEEMISGMLTAIKTFVEDAFNQKNPVRSITMCLSVLTFTITQ